MKLIFYIFIPLVYSELHTFMASYSGQRFSEIPEFSAATTLDDHQIDYYDSKIKKLIPRQDWMEEFASTEMWKDYTEIREKLQQIYKNNIHVLMDTFTQSHGVHTYQRMCGCQWDDETGESQVFDRHGYDGEDFISLDLEKLRYIASVPQASPTAMKWNNDREQLEFLKQYFGHECVYWLKEILHLYKATLKKTDPPEVSLLQKNLEEYVECHVTGFLFRNTRILWRKNGQALSNSRKLEYRDTLPNEDGTFQRTVALYVHPDEWREDEYSCAVEHKSLIETIQKILTEDQIKRNSKFKHESASDASYIIYRVIISVTVLLIGLFVLWKLWKKHKRYYKKINCDKSSLSSEHVPSQALVSTPSP